MEILNSSIHYLSLLWLFPIIFMFHDFEELLIVEKWIKVNGDSVMKKLPSFGQKFFRTSFQINTHHFAKDVFWIYLTIVTVTLVAVFFSVYLLYLSLLHIFFLHVFSHIASALYLRMYTPGVITAVTLVFPYSLYAYYRLFSEQIIYSQDILWSLLLTILIVPIGLVLLLQGREGFLRS